MREREEFAPDRRGLAADAGALPARDAVDELSRNTMRPRHRSEVAALEGESRSHDAEVERFGIAGGGAFRNHQKPNKSLQFLTRKPKRKLS